MALSLFTDFSDYALGDIQSQGWTARYVTSALTSSILADAGATGGKLLQYKRSGSNRKALTWDAFSADADRADFEVVARMRTLVSPGSGSLRCGVAGRITGGSGSESCYAGLIGSAGDNRRINEYEGGSSASLASQSWSPPPAAGEWFCVRFRCETAVSDAQLRLKMWIGDAGDETGGWDVEYLDTSPRSVGEIGVFDFYGGCEVDWIGVATGGGTAPTGPGGGDPDEITGSLSATLDNATLSSTGELLISGSLSATLADATSSASGAAPITGALSAILDDATLTATGAGEVEGFGSLSVTLDGVSLSATGALDIVGQVSVTLANVSLAASGELLIQGEASLALDDVTLSAAGELITGESGRLNVVLDDVTLSAVGVLSAEGSANIQLDAATLVAQGQLLIQGAASIALDDVTLSTDPGSAPLPNRYYGVIPGGGMVVDVLENGTTTGRAIELRVNDSVYGDRLAVIVGVKGIIDYLNTKETRPIA